MTTKSLLLSLVALTLAFGAISCPTTAGVVVLANRSPDTIEFRIEPIKGQPSSGSLRPGEVRPTALSAPAQIFVGSGKARPHYRLRPDHIYTLQGDPLHVDLHEITFGAEVKDEGETPPLRVAEGHLAAGVLPVKVLIDQREPETARVWEPRLRRRVERASEILQRFTGMRLEIVSLGIWKLGTPARSFSEALGDLEQNVRAEPARLVIAFTRQYAIGPNDFACSDGLRGPLATHLLVPDSAPRIDGEDALKMLLHELGHFWGAVHVPDADSLMCLPLHTTPGGVPRQSSLLMFDATNTLIMSLVSEEVRARGINRLMELSPPRKHRLCEIYSAVASVLPDSATSDLAARLAPPGAQPAPGSTPPLDMPVRVTEIPVPEIPGGYAIWSGVAADRNGHPWFAVSSEGVKGASAHVFEFDPVSQRAEDRGDVISQLQAAGRQRVGESQGLICGPMLSSADGDLYFASLGEERPTTNGDRPPPWGSHLWRIRPPDHRWEHLAAVPEGLVALALHGPYLYALGYPAGVLYQYRRDAGQLRKVAVGSAAGHVCRGLVCDPRGHLYVPRFKEAGGPGRPIAVSLVELDEGLRPLAETPLAHDFDVDSHRDAGIIAHFFQPDGSVVFITYSGAIYRILSSATGAAKVLFTAKLDHPGTVAAAFKASPRKLLLAVVQRGAEPSSAVWVVYDLETQRTTVYSMEEAATLKDLELCGQATADRTGKFYVGGTYGRGPLEISPRLLDFLKSRGYSEEKRSLLVDNARRAHQPLLFTVEYVDVGAE